jgi:hypothetical protein
MPWRRREVPEMMYISFRQELNKKHAVKEVRG